MICSAKEFIEYILPVYNHSAEPAAITVRMRCLLPRTSLISKQEWWVAAVSPELAVVLDMQTKR